MFPAPRARALDMVCAGTSGDGLICIDAGGIKHLNRRNGSIPGDRISDLVVCDGKVIFAVEEAILSYDGALVGPPNAVGRGLVGNISCDDEGRLWAASQSTVSSWDGSTWRHHELRAIAPAGTRRPYVAGLAAGPKGTVWLTMPDGIAAHFNGRVWTVHRQGQGFRDSHRFGPILVDSKGQAWLPYAQGLYTFKGERWESLRTIASAHHIVEDKSNRLWLTSGARIAVVDGGRTRAFDAEQNIRELAVDSAGAVWTATEFGLGRFADNKWQSWQMHNSDLPDNDLRSIVVLGEGAAPPAGGAKAKGMLAGTLLWSDSKPMAEADIHICGVRAYDFGANKGPCDDKPLAAKSRSAADGKFVFRDIPAANYYLVVRPKGQQRWIRFATEAARFKLAPGGERQVGLVVIDARQRE